MTNNKKYLCLAISGLVLFLAACTQDPARVDDRSSQFYGRGFGRDTGYRDSGYNNESFTRESPHYAAPAAVPSVGVSDLAPPDRSSASNQMAAMQASQPNSFGTAPAGNGNRYIWPVVGGKVVSHFGPKPNGKSNDGINIAVPEGEPVSAAADGMVVYAGNELPSYGNMVIIRHDGGWMTAYAHMRNIAPKKNDYVKQGDIIGYVGTTGNVKTPQVHFALRNGKTPVDPEQYLPRS